ncbi:uncharacterized protein METZ01_LOCUS232935, partial [marine metagenome]
MAEDFGAYLKSERELRGVTLEELHSKTKIPVRYLKALEKNQFDKLPEEVFIKGYIRSFAKIIGAKEDELLSTYIDITKTASFTDTNNQTTSNQKHFTFEPKFIFVLTIIVLFLSGSVWGINILIRTFYKDAAESVPTISEIKQNETQEKLEKDFTIRNQKINEAPSSLKTTETTTEASPENLKIDSEISINNSSINLSKKTAAGLKNESEAPNVSTNNTTQLKLVIKVKDNVWFNIAVDDSPVESFVLSKGSEKTFYGEKQYLLNVGSRNAIDITLNGSKVSFPK